MRQLRYARNSEGDIPYEVRTVQFREEVNYTECSLSTWEYDELVKKEEIISQEKSGCFTYNKSYKYGMGVNLVEIASLDFEYAKSCQKLVQAQSGQRVILKKSVYIPYLALIRRNSDPSLVAPTTFSRKSFQSQRCSKSSPPG